MLNTKSTYFVPLLGFFISLIHLEGCKFQAQNKAALQSINSLIIKKDLLLQEEVVRGNLMAVTLGPLIPTFDTFSKHY